MTKEISRQIDEIAGTNTNMLQPEDVLYKAQQMNFFALVDFLSDKGNWEEYFQYFRFQERKRSSVMNSRKKSVMERPCNKIGRGLECNVTNDIACVNCGFNPSEDLFRKEYIRRYGLTHTAEGTKKLIVKQKLREKLNTSLWKAKKA